MGGGVELNGQPATLVGWGASEIALRTASSSPPGARLEALVIGEDGVRHGFRVKVHRCRRQEDASFVIVAGLLELRREARDALDAHAAAIGASTTPRQLG